MKSTDTRILIECLARENAIAASPARKPWWGILDRHDDDVAYGPRYKPSAWFGDLTDAERQHYMRGCYRLSKAGLLLVVASTGGRLERIKLTDAGRAAALVELKRAERAGDRQLEVPPVEAADA
jgi:hypothetical protein